MTADVENSTLYYDINVALDDAAVAIYRHIYGSSVAQVCYPLLISLPLVVGPLLCVPIVLYEIYGADPQKRTIMNRLLSFVISNIAISEFAWSVIRIIRHASGLLPFEFTEWVFVLRYWLMLTAILCYNQLTIFRFLYVVVWKRMKVINDQFWITVLGMSTYLIAFHSCVSTYLYGFDATYGIQGIIDVTKHDGKEGKRYAFSNI